MMAWACLVLAILFEVCGTTAMKLSDGLHKPGPSVVVFACYGVSIALLTVAVRSIDIGIAYAIWSALGMTLITAIGILWFAEPASAWKIGCIALIGIGVVGLHLGPRLGA